MNNSFFLIVAFLRIVTGELPALFAVLGEKCAESLFYGPESLSLTGTADGHSNYFSTLFANEEHESWLQVITNDGTTEVAKIVWTFQQRRTLSDRLSNAVANGELVHYRVTDFTDNNKEYEYEGEWWYSDRAGLTSEKLTTASSSSCCLSADDGLWGAASGTIDGDAGVIPSDFWGVGVYTGTEDATSCTFLYRNGDGISYPSMKTYMYLVEPSPSANPTSIPSNKPTSIPTAPTEAPVFTPTVNPSPLPSQNPSSVPTSNPSSTPTSKPTSNPTSPSSAPTSKPSSAPSVSPSSAPSLGIGPWTCDTDTYDGIDEDCAETDSGETSTIPCVPGWKIVGKGFNSVTGLMGNRIWDFPLLAEFGLDGITYRTPDQSYFILNEVSQTTQSLDSQTEYFSSVKKSQKSFSATYGIEQAYNDYKGTKKNLAGSMLSTIQSGMGIEASYTDTVWRNVQRGKYSVNFLASTSILSVQVQQRLNGMLCSSRFFDDVMRLPSEYDYRRYGQILSNYGTHVVLSVTMGGEISSFSDFESCEYSTTQERDAEVSAAGKKYSTFIAAYGEEKVYLLGSEMRKSVCTVRGGNDGIYFSGGYEAWDLSLISGKYDLAPINLRLIPMYELMGDAVRRNNMEQAFYYYHQSKARAGNRPIDPELDVANLTNCEQWTRGSGYKVGHHWSVLPLFALVLTVSLMVLL